MNRLRTPLMLALSVAVLGACTSVSVGVDGSGRVGGGVSVGTGGVSVGVGGTAQIPPRPGDAPGAAAPDAAASAPKPVMQAPR
jgi:hypothetical protein